MRALVVYESMFGNTKAIAEAVAEGLSAGMDVGMVEVGAAPASLGEDVQLLVVGAPTHAFGLSRPGTRRSAAEQAGGHVVSAGVGVREWLDSLQGGAAAAAFSTRIVKPRLPGSAARAAAKRLSRRGFHLVVPAMDFFVTGTPGPIVQGELERARRWGGKLAAELAAAVPGRPAS